jgi:spermidine synthase
MFKITKQLVSEGTVIERIYVSKDYTFEGIEVFETEVEATEKKEELESLDNFGAKYKVTEIS